MKELIIIVYRINISGYTRQAAEECMRELMNLYNLRDDLELKSNNYLIREIWLPIENDSMNNGNQTDVKVIYPISQSYAFTPEVNDLITEITDKISNDPTNGFRHQWNSLVRELKLKRINSTI